LGWQWARSKLSQRQTFDIVFSADPVPVIDQILLHVAGERDGSADAHCAQPEEIPDELPD